MASEDHSYYDKVIHTIDAMSKVLEDDSLVQLYKEQCKQMIRSFMQVRDVLGERKDMKTDNRFWAILKELYRQTFEANAVLDSCCCKVEVKQDGKTVRYSWLQVALTQGEEMVFKVIWDDLNWCLGLVAEVGHPIEITEEQPRAYSYSTKLTDMDSKLIDADKSDLKNRLEEFLEQGPPAGATQKRDRELATFLLARLNNDEQQYIFFGNCCDSDNVWSRKQTLNYLGPCVTATDWLGVRLARKAFINQQAGDFSVERDIMAPLNHPNVVRFITCSDEDPAILMECVETTLEIYLEQRAKKYAAQPSGMLGRISFSAGLNILEVVDLMYNIAFVMAYLHGNGVAHCDIKPSNLLVNPCKVPGFDGYVQVKIADFGVSKAGLDEDSLRDSSKRSRGTTIYRAPELNGKPKNVDLKKADMFSYALTCWHILHGKAPFAKMPVSTLHQDLLRGIRPEIDSGVPNMLADLIQRCWCTKPQERPTFSEVSLLLQRYKEELLLGVVPLESISVPENKAKRRWKVFQSSFKIVKTLAMQILPPQISRNAKQDDSYTFPGDLTSNCKSEIVEEETTSGPSHSFFRQSHVLGCFSRPEPMDDFPAYPGSHTCLDLQVLNVSKAPQFQVFIFPYMLLGFHYHDSF
ncbi:hypothetical protein M758_9G022200 [Ceratodon purpureus]|nr:hypothetical protein M758_9G022200 [Ceratodon purpureus]